MASKTKETGPKAKTSRQVWLKIKTASMQGVEDYKLAEKYGVKQEAIRMQRSRDAEWKAIVKTQRDILKGAVGSKVEPDHDLLQLVQESAPSLSERNRILALKIAGKGLAAALDKRGELRPHLMPNEIKDLKDLTDIAAKAGSWSSEQQVTVNCQAFAGAAVSISNGSEQDNTQIIDNE